MRLNSRFLFGGLLVSKSKCYTNLRKNSISNASSCDKIGSDDKAVPSSSDKKNNKKATDTLVSEACVCCLVMASATYICPYFTTRRLYVSSGLVLYTLFAAGLSMSAQASATCFYYGGTNGRRILFYTVQI